MKDDVKLARWLNDEMDERELKEFMASPDYDTYRKIKEYSAQLTVPHADMDALYSAIAQKRENRRRVRKMNPWIARIAAVLVLALGITFYLYTTHTTTQIAGLGERTQFLLPDNSSVTLNSGSKAEFRTWNWDNNRSVEMEGEAFFKVAKGKTFDVMTPMGKVTVVGTQFNVRSREGRFEVSCFEGKVKVSYNKQQVLLTPGKGVAFEEGQMLQIPSNTIQPGWLNYEVRFTKEKLANVISELERQYNVDIQVTAELSEEHFNGTIPMDDLDTALNSIMAAYKLKAVKTGNAIVLSSQ